MYGAYNRLFMVPHLVRNGSAYKGLQMHVIINYFYYINFVYSSDSFVSLGSGWSSHCRFLLKLQKKRERVTETERQRDRHRHKHTDTQRQRQLDRQTGRDRGNGWVGLARRQVTGGRAEETMTARVTTKSSHAFNKARRAFWRWDASSFSSSFLFSQLSFSFSFVFSPLPISFPFVVR